jgi:uncharacterized protein YjbI with pentapeptide repeats
MMEISARFGRLIGIYPPVASAERMQLTAAEVYQGVQAHQAYIADSRIPPLDMSARILPPRIDLRHTMLNDASFRNSEMRSADLTGADLTNANFERAILIGARLAKTNCSGATFTDAVLRGADLTDCKSLQTAQLAGSDVTGAKLPGPVASFEMLKTLADAGAQTISMLAACAHGG